MDVAIKSATAILFAYLLGSISWAYVVGRVARGIDMTEVGDGRIGAAFSIRRLGLAWGITVGVLDFLKGAVAVGTALALSLPIVAVILAGIAAVAGHNWSAFFGFKGGRGAATTYGILVVLVLPALLAACAVMVIPYYATHGSAFIRGIHRTTLMFAILMVITSLLVWIDVAIGFLPEMPWVREYSVLVAILPLALLAPNLIKGSDISR